MHICLCPGSALHSAHPHKEPGLSGSPRACTNDREPKLLVLGHLIAEIAPDWLTQ